MITRAHHDLVDVTAIEITGWKGPRQVIPQPSGEHGVTITAAPRHDGEYWTFTAPRNGVLTCSTSLLGSPSLLTESMMPLTVRLAADRMADVTVMFDGEPEEGEGQ